MYVQSLEVHVEPLVAKHRHLQFNRYCFDTGSLVITNDMISLLLEPKFGKPYLTFPRKSFDIRAFFLLFV